MRNKAFSVRIASFESHLNRVFFKVLLKEGQSILMVKLELWNFPKNHDILMSTLKQKFLNLKFEYQNVLHGGKPLYSYFHRKFFICSIRIVFSKNLSCKLQQERMEKITFLCENRLEFFLTLKNPYFIFFSWKYIAIHSNFINFFLSPKKSIFKLTSLDRNKAFSVGLHHSNHISIGYFSRYYSRKDNLIDGETWVMKFSKKNMKC